MAAVPKPFANFVSLFLGPMYLVLLASILCRASQLQMVTAVIAVFIGAAALIALLIPLCSRLASNDQGRKYSVSTLMLVTAVLAIYLGFISQLSSRMDVSSPSISEYAFYCFLASLFMYLTTAILVHFTDSFISLFQAFRKLSQKFRRDEP